MSGPSQDRHWLTAGGPDLDFFDLKGVIEALLARLHLGEAEYEPAAEAGYQRDAPLACGWVVPLWACWVS